MFLFTQEELFLPIRIIPSCQLFSFSFERCQKNYPKFEFKYAFMQETRY